MATALKIPAPTITPGLRERLDSNTKITRHNSAYLDNFKINEKIISEPKSSLEKRVATLEVKISSQEVS